MLSNHDSCMNSAYLKIDKGDLFFTFAYNLEFLDVFLAASIIEKLKKNIILYMFYLFNINLCTHLLWF